MQRDEKEGRNIARAEDKEHVCFGSAQMGEAMVFVACLEIVSLF